MSVITPSVLYNTFRTDVERHLLEMSFDVGSTDVELNLLPASTPVREVAIHQCLTSLTKKMAPMKGSSEAREKAINLFLQCNADNLEWVPPIEGSWERKVLDQMKWLAYKELSELDDWQSLLTQAETGPGASVGSRGKNSFFEKLFVNTLTTTSPSLYREWLAFLGQRGEWIAAEICRIRSNPTPLKVVRGDNLSTVRKTAEIDRTIGTAPSLNMVFQKALSTHFELALKRFYGFDLAIQAKRNRRMAKIGSKSGRIATVDSTSASDLNSLKMCEYVLPSTVWAAINDCRSPEVKVDNDYVTLNMVSPMGNGFTFTLMTYLFSCLLKAICIVDSKRFTRYSDKTTEFAVFGDDIIVPTHLYASVVKGLEMLGHRPNKSKSYSDGSFRESCGSDCFLGIDVRGVYCRTYSNAYEHRFSLINRLNRWSAKWKVPLPETMRLLLPKDKARFFVPPDEADAAGIHVPKFMSSNGHNYVARVPKVKLLQIFYRSKERLGLMRPGFDNPLGFLLSASIGRVSSNGISRRQDGSCQVFKRVRRQTPGWECEVDLLKHNVRITDWRVAVYVNLTS